VVAEGLERLAGGVQRGGGAWEGRQDGERGDGVEDFGGGVGEGRGVEEGCDCADGYGGCGGCGARVVLDAAADGYVFQGEGCGGEFGGVCEEVC
jgi:hypothetical protein